MILMRAIAIYGLGSLSNRLANSQIPRRQAEIDQLQDEYPNLQSFPAEQLRAELVAIEADTYAEFVRAGRLNKELSPFLQEVLPDGE